MATVFATKNGDWSDPTVWNTGALPESGDEVRDGGYAVVIDQNVDLGSTGLLNAAGGGYFRVNAAGITITCGQITGTTNGSLRLYHPSGYVYLNANIVANSALRGRPVVATNSAGGIEVVGDVKADASYGIHYTYYTETPYGIKITGDVYAGPTGFGIAALRRPIEVIGNLYGSIAPPGVIAMGAINANTLPYPLLITGDVIAYGPQFAVVLSTAITIIDGNVRLIEEEEYEYPYPAISQSEKGYPIVVTGEVVNGQFGTPAIGPRVIRGVLPDKVDLLHGDADDYSIVSYYPKRLQQLYVQATVSSKTEIQATVSVEA